MLSCACCWHHVKIEIVRPLVVWDALLFVGPAGPTTAKVLGGQMGGKNWRELGLGGCALTLLAFLVLASGGRDTAGAQQIATYTDARAYCQAIGTIDEAGPTYRGTETPAWISAAVEDHPEYASVTWRCFDGAVLACVTANSVGCSKAAWLHPESLDYVLKNPDVRAQCRSAPRLECVSGTHCLIGCVGGKPSVNRDTRPLDARGFYVDEWKVVSAARLPGRLSSRGFQNGKSTPAPARPQVPVTTTGIGSEYFDPAYRQSEGRQHLGVDLPAAAGAIVMSPVTGQVVVNQTMRSDIMQAYLVIKETGSGIEHVLGHLTSTLQPGAKIGRGEAVGTVRPWAGNSHIHWGANSRGVLASMGSSPEGQWGWGRAPASVTRAQAAARGWIDLGPYVSSAEAAAMRPAAAAPAEALPVAASNVLGARFPGWSKEPRAEGCDPDWKGAVKTGDFNGDHRPDFLIKVQHRSFGYIVAMIAESGSYRLIVIEQPQAKLFNMGIQIARWGEYSSSGAGFRVQTGSDAAVIGLCESSSAVMVYGNGRFAMAEGTP